MKTYAKPSINVIELQLTENIAAVPTTVYTGGSRALAKKSKRKDSLDSLSGLVPDGVANEFLQSATA